MKKTITAIILSVILSIASVVPVQAHSRPSRSRAPGAINGYPCGGSLPPCYVLWRESRGNFQAQNPESSASGGWQFLDSTWARHGGYHKARYAPWQVQNDRARIVWNNGKGCRHWRAC